jgi:segregation and condensation protein A
LFDLVKALGTMLERAKNRPVYEVEAADVTVAGMIRYLREQFVEAGENQPVFILRIFEKQRTRRAIVALFLAVLEMVRMQAVVLTQEDLFGEIALQRHESSTRFSRAISPSRRSKTNTSSGPRSGRAPRAMGASDSLEFK